MNTNDEFEVQLGQKIKDLRIEKGYSQTNLAQVLGFDSPTAISLIESGNRSLKLRDLVTLCQLFDKEYGYFLDQGSKAKSRKIDNAHEDIESLAKKLLKMARDKKGR
jgi:transcriptional regulator with XRE-family HTH domain